ncbi:MAG: rhomboid family intramembrane serine protease [Verrucomicrobiota bacterium]
MGLYDRDYFREEPGPAGPFGRGRQARSVVFWLIAINVGVFVIDLILEKPGAFYKPLERVGFFNTGLAINGLQLWRFLTYQFLHAGFFHLLFNMLALFFFGPLLEQWWGKRRFLAFYLLAGMGGAYVYALLTSFGVFQNSVPLGVRVGFQEGTLEIPTSLVGASGSIYGILIGAAVLYPHTRVMLLFPPIPLKLRTLAIGLIAFGVASIVLEQSGTRNLNGGGQAAHLGGALLGFFLIRNPHWLNFVGEQVSRTRASDRRGPVPANPGLKVVEAEEVKPAKKGFSLFGGQKKKPAARSAGKPTRTEIDAVLDKISAQGISSLSAQERAVLEKAQQDLK